MDDLKLEYSSVNKNLEKNIDFFKNIWARGVHPISPTYIKYANQTHTYLTGENKDYVNPAYKGIELTYNFDQYGFRHYPNYKPTSNKKVFCYGCSMTFGFSAPEEHNWVYLLANKLGSWQVKNYGVPAAGAGQIARTCYQSITMLDKKDYPDVVYVFLPDLFRTEYIGNINNKPANFLLNMHLGRYPTLDHLINAKKDFEVDTHLFKNSEIHKKMLNYYEYSSGVHSFFETVRSLALIKEVLESRNIPWFWYSWSHSIASLKKETIEFFLGSNTLFDENGLLMIEISDERKGRDGTHVGLEYSDELSELFLNLYKNYELNKNPSK